MRAALLIGACLSIALGAVAGAQDATVVVRVVRRDTGEPVAYAAVSVLSHGIERLAGESGVFALRGLPPGTVHLRVRRIGFAPRDTTLVLGAGDTARVRIEMTRLALALPAMVVDGTCTDRTPLEEKSAVLAALFDQVAQNAERLRLLAAERPFEIQATRTRGILGEVGAGAPRTDTITRGPLPPVPYAPRRVYRRVNGVWAVTLPELADIADTGFTNNHCLWYAGQERFGADSVIRVDFEPVPWLAKDVDLEGSIFVRVDGYALVGMVTRLNRIPSEFRRSMERYAARARFEEQASGAPVLAEWEITNTLRDSRGTVVVESGRVTGVRWLDSSTVRRDTASPARQAFDSSGMPSLELLAAEAGRASRALAMRGVAPSLLCEPAHPLVDSASLAACHVLVPAGAPPIVAAFARGANAPLRAPAEGDGTAALPACPATLDESSVPRALLARITAPVVGVREGRWEGRLTVELRCRSRSASDSVRILGNEYIYQWTGRAWVMYQHSWSRR